MRAHSFLDRREETLFGNTTQCRLHAHTISIQKFIHLIILSGNSNMTSKLKKIINRTKTIASIIIMPTSFNHYEVGIVINMFSGPCSTRKCHQVEPNHSPLFPACSSSTFFTSSIFLGLPCSSLAMTFP